jgi:predicted nucleic acid-binding protein
MDRGEDPCTCAIVLTEVHSGLLPAEERATSALLESCEYLDISPPSARQAGKWRRTIRPGGRSLSTADVLIAAAAVAYNATVVTGNVGDFPIPGLGLLELPRTNRRQ